MRIETVSLKGNHEWYEDAIIQNSLYARFGVLDGATSLEAYRGKNGETGAYLAANIVKRELEKVDVISSSLLETVLNANNVLKQEMMQAGIDTENAQSWWSCALACIQINEHQIDYVHVGDCMLVVKYEDGDVRLLSRDQVAPLGKETVAAYLAYKAKGIYNHTEIVRYLKPLLVENRNKANRVNGYTVLNGQAQLAHFLEYGTINKNRVKAIYIMSDGLFLPPYFYSTEAEKWDKTIQLIDQLSLSGYANWLLEEEQNDVDCEKHPRLKVSDDKTGCKISF